MFTRRDFLTASLASTTCAVLPACDPQPRSLDFEPRLEDVLAFQNADWIVGPFSRFNIYVPAPRVGLASSPTNFAKFLRIRAAFQSPRYVLHFRTLEATCECSQEKACAVGRTVRRTALELGFVRSSLYRMQLRRVASCLDEVVGITNQLFGIITQHHLKCRDYAIHASATPDSPAIQIAAMARKHDFVIDGLPWRSINLRQQRGLAACCLEPDCRFHGWFSPFRDGLPPEIDVEEIRRLCRSELQAVLTRDAGFYGRTKVEDARFFLCGLQKVSQRIEELLESPQRNGLDTWLIPWNVGV